MDKLEYRDEKYDVNPMGYHCDGKHFWVEQYWPMRLIIQKKEPIMSFMIHRCAYEEKDGKMIVDLDQSS